MALPKKFLTRRDFLDGGSRYDKLTSIDPTAFGAVLENNPDEKHATRNTDALNAAIEAAAADNADVYISGKIGINGPIVLKTGVRLYGRRPLYATSTIDETGSWLVWVGGSSGVMVHAGEATQEETLQRAGMEGVGLDGKSQTGVTLLSIRSNSPTSAEFNTKLLTFRQCVFAKAGIGLQWGDHPQEQCDFVHFEQCIWRNSGPIIVNGANCGDGSVFDTCTFSNMANGIVGDPYIDLVISGFLSFRSCSAGGDGLDRYDFIRGAGAVRITLTQCQSEKMRYFFRHLGANDVYTVTLNSCIINDDISLENICRVAGNGNFISARIFLTHAGAKYYGNGDRFQASLGGRVIDTAGVFYNNRIAATAATQLVNRGERLVGAVPASGTGQYEEIVARTGWIVPVWAASTAYSPAGPSGWIASTTYAVNDVVVPTFENGFQWICTVAGTSGTTEPDFQPTPGITYVDGTVTWVENGGVAGPLLRRPTADNEHVYRLVTAGTSDTVEPIWPTTAGATVSDGSCIWQEAGPSALVIPRSL